MLCRGVQYHASSGQEDREGQRAVEERGGDYLNTALNFGTHTFSVVVIHTTARRTQQLLTAFYVLHIVRGRLVCGRAAAFDPGLFSTSSRCKTLRQLCWSKTPALFSSANVQFLVCL